MLNYKCPSCGAYMVYNTDKKCLVCEYCETTQSIDALTEEERAELLAEGGQSTESWEETVTDEATGQTIYLRHYICKNCGGEIMTDENTAATICGFCGNPTLIEDRLSGEQSPAKIIPFSVSKDAAIDAYRKWTRKGMLTPSVFRSKASLEKITGMYVPFWLYDFKARGTLQAHATRVRNERKGKYEYIHTDHFEVERVIRVAYDRIPADASKKMPDEVMDQLEPYRYDELVEFQLPYLSGFQADKYDYTGADLKERASARANQYAGSALRSTVSGYTSVDVVNEDIELNNTKQEYVMFPVWTLNYNYKGQQYMITMNGQTGKIVGKLPVSGMRALGWFFGVFAGSFLVQMLLTLLF